MRQDHDHVFGDRLETDRHETQLIEFSVVRNSARTTWVGGLAYQDDHYQADVLPSFNYHYRVPALFGQFDYDLSDDITIAASTRWDDHSQYGSELSPRISLLYSRAIGQYADPWDKGSIRQHHSLKKLRQLGCLR